MAGRAVVTGNETDVVNSFVRLNTALIVMYLVPMVGDL